MKRIATASVLAVAFCSTSACNQVDPNDEAAGDGDGDGDESADDVELDDTYYPLADGATWSYLHTRQDQTQWTEDVEMEAVDFDGQEAFLLRDNEDAQGEITESILMRTDGQVSRVHKDVWMGGVIITKVDYEPGFLRFDAGWRLDDVVDWTYERTEYDGNDILQTVSDRTQRFTVEDGSVEVDVPAGTFDCVQVLREREDNGDRDRFWFAAGVGKVKREDLNTGSLDELESYDIPE